MFMLYSAAQLVVHTARVVTEEGVRHGGVAADDGSIVVFGSDMALPESKREIDAEENFLLPD